MRKVGLSVCYDTKNYGSQLQVFATVKKIEELGYETEIIRYKKKISVKFICQTIPRFLNSYFIKNKIEKIKKKRDLNKHPDIYREIEKRNKRFDEFVKINYKNMSELYQGWNSLIENTKNNYDTVLCGSDQLWLPSNLGSHFYTLEFVENDKNKIAYATSFGVSQIPWYQRKRTQKYLNGFSHLSCREEKGTKIIEELTGKKVPIVLDPTLLLEKQEWDRIIPKEKIINDKYLFCYFLGNNVEHRKVAEDLARVKKLKIVTIPFLDNFVEYDKKFGDYKMYDIDAFDFVNLIRNAEYILTDSFHGSVFSIINHKKFITFNRFLEGTKTSTNSRIDNLCTMLGLDERRYRGNIEEQVIRDIDYDKVDDLLNNARRNSLEYLENALEGNS